MKKLICAALLFLLSMCVFNIVYQENKARLLECSIAITQTDNTQAAEYMAISTEKRHQEYQSCKMYIYYSPFYSFQRAVDSSNDYISNDPDWYFYTVANGSKGVCYSPNSNEICYNTYCFLN